MDVRYIDGDGNHRSKPVRGKGYRSARIRRGPYRGAYVVRRARLMRRLSAEEQGRMAATFAEFGVLPGTYQRLAHGRSTDQRKAERYITAVRVHYRRRTAEGAQSPVAGLDRAILYAVVSCNQGRKP